MLLGIDASLDVAVHLAIGQGLWRDAVTLDWNTWS
jgi:hypothetical protein